MGVIARFFRSLRRRRRAAEDRFGGRVIIEQRGVLEVCDRTIHGVIHDVGLRGAFFAAAELPLPGSRGCLRRSDGLPIDVRVVWRQLGPAGGVGLAFDR